MRPLSWLSRRVIIKKLSYPIRRANGRAFGRVVVRHRGGGVRSPLMRAVDSGRLIWTVPATVVGFEKGVPGGPYFAALSYPIGILSYIVMPFGLKVGDQVEAGWTCPVKVGNCLPLINIPLNIKIHGIESRPGTGSVYIRAAGNWAVILSKGAREATLLFRNGKRKRFNLYCFATIGRISNLHQERQKLKKAGDSRRRGIRPSVRGVAMNPVDHPHGGGKGKKSKNSVPEAPWGRLGARKKRAKNDF